MKLNLDREYNILVEWKEEKKLKLSEILWENKTILYFYPKDNTPGCSIENDSFSSMKWDFENLGYKLVWVSKDSIESHKKFAEKKGLKVDLISDETLDFHNETWAFWEKNNYWIKVQWVIRSTFIVDNSWEVLKEFKNVKANWHAERIFKEIT